MDKSKLKHSEFTNSGFNTKELIPFIKLAKQVDSTDEFIDKVRKITDVSYEVSEWFQDEYGAGGMLSVEKASADFIEDVENGEFEYITNPYLYKRKEIRQ